MDITSPVRRRTEIPEAIRSLASVADPDYADLFTLTASDAATWEAEQWARTLLEGEAGLAGQFVWRVLLGLRLAWRRSPDSLAGWRIVSRENGHILLEAQSRLLEGNLLVHIEGDEVSLATFIRFLAPKGERTWNRLSSMHHKGVPELLQDAYKTLKSASPHGS